MSVDLWTAPVLDGIKTRLEGGLASALTAISDAGGDSVTAPAQFEVQDDFDTVSALPFVAIRTAGETEVTDLLPAAYRLQIPLEVVVIMTPEGGPTGVDNAARTYARGVLNVLTLYATAQNVAGLFYIGTPTTRIERVEGGAHRWRRAAIVGVTAYVATTKTVTT